jgi:hypothetical protein
MTSVISNFMTGSLHHHRHSTNSRTQVIRDCHWHLQIFCLPLPPPVQHWLKYSSTHSRHMRPANLHSSVCTRDRAQNFITVVILVNWGCYGYNCDHYSCYYCNQYIMIPVVGIVTTFQTLGYYRSDLVIWNTRTLPTADNWKLRISKNLSGGYRVETWGWTDIRFPSALCK